MNPRQQKDCLPTRGRVLRQSLGSTALSSTALSSTALSSTALSWGFPLTHTWYGGWSRLVFESVWAPLHFAWVVLCACVLLNTRRRSTVETSSSTTSPRGRERWSRGRRQLCWWSGLILSYAMTVAGCWAAGLEGSRTAQIVLLALEYSVLAVVVALFLSRDPRSRRENEPC